MKLSTISEIRFPRRHYAALIEHCKRKFRAEYFEGEEHERQAFGLVGGRILDSGQIMVTDVFPLIRNMRHEPQFQEHITKLMESIGPGSAEFPNCTRGWVSDPKELMLADRTCSRSGSLLFGNYHMHTVSGDRCTKADNILGADNNMWGFIISMVDLERYIMRAYFENQNVQEARITFCD